MTAEKHLQECYGTSARAEKFEQAQKLDYLNPSMIAFIAEREMAFIATADAQGHCDNSIRTGAKGFIAVLDAHTLVYPEYRGNGVLASLGNIHENPHIGLLLIDFFQATIGLHINGSARIIDSPQHPQAHDAHAERWVEIHVDEAYIHCSKHIPTLSLVRPPHHWSNETTRITKTDFFDIQGEPTGTSQPNNS